MIARERGNIILAWALCAYGILSLSSMALMSLGATVFFAASVYVLSRNPEPREFTPALLPWALASVAFFGACLLSLIVARFFPVEANGPGGFSELKKFHFFLYPPMIALALNRWGSIERHPFWKAWFGMAGISALIAVLQFYARDIFPSDWLSSRFFRPIGMSDRFHGQGLMFFHLSFASALCFAASAALARALWPLPKDRRWLWLAFGLFLCVGVFLSYSRTASFTLVAIFVFLGFLKRPLWGLATLVVAILLGIAAWQWSPTLQGRWRNNQVGNFERIRMWESAWDMFRDRPITGVGFNRTGEYSPLYATRRFGERPQFTSHAHNNLLDALASTGLLGFAAFLAWWGVVIGMAVRVYRHSAKEQRWLPVAALTGLLAFHLNGLTQINFWDGKTQHTLMLWIGIVLALWLRRATSSAPTLPSR